MKLLKKNLSVSLTVLCFSIFNLSVLAGSGESPVPEEGRVNTAIRAQRGFTTPERDPFSVSARLLQQAFSGRYVAFSGEGIEGFYLPSIEITGVMAVDDRIMATAVIETLGSVTLKINDRIIIKPQKSSDDILTSFVIKDITANELVIILDGGPEIRGRFR